MCEQVAADQDTRHAIDEIGAQLGVAPTATAGLGEHIVVPAHLVALTDRDRSGAREALYQPRWDQAIWYDADGIDTGRPARPATTPAPVAYRSYRDAHETVEVVFIVEHHQGGTRFVPAENQWYDTRGRLHHAEHTGAAQP